LDQLNLLGDSQIPNHDFSDKYLINKSMKEVNQSIKSKSQNKIIPKRIYSRSRRNTTNGSKINPESICSLSTRDEQLLAKNFECFRLSNE